MDNKNILPPLPASDPSSMARNAYSGFYNIGSKQYWKDAEISLNTLKDEAPCPHYFKQMGSEIQCIKCHAGFMGPGISAIDGKLFVRNQQAVL